MCSDLRQSPPNPAWERGRRVSLTLWSPWASAVCECEQSLGPETQETEGGGGFEEGSRYWDQGGGKVYESRASRGFFVTCFPACLWPLLAIWMEPWPSMTCLHKHSGTNVSTRYDIWGFSFLLSGLLCWLKGSLSSGPSEGGLGSSLLPPDFDSVTVSHSGTVWHCSAAVGGWHCCGVHL